MWAGSIGVLAHKQGCMRVGPESSGSDFRDCERTRAAPARFVILKEMIGSIANHMKM